MRFAIEDYEKLWKRSAVWIPHGELANSPGEPIFDYTGGKFGPFAGQMFIGDQSRSNIMRVSLDKVGGEYQGVIFDFVNRLQTGCIRMPLAKTELFGSDKPEEGGDPPEERNLAFSR